MNEPIFKLFGATAEKVKSLIAEGKEFKFIEDSVEGRLVIKVYVK